LSAPVERKSACSLIVISACRGVRRAGSAFLAGLFFLLLIVPLSAQQDDPSDIFLKSLSVRAGRVKSWNTKTDLKLPWPNFGSLEA